MNVLGRRRIRLDHLQPQPTMPMGHDSENFFSLARAFPDLRIFLAVLLPFSLLVAMGGSSLRTSQTT